MTEDILNNGCVSNLSDCVPILVFCFRENIHVRVKNNRSHNGHAFFAHLGTSGKQILAALSKMAS